MISNSQLCPEGFRGKPGDVLVAVQIGAELGVSPLQALSGIAVINGRACLWGDLIVALVQRSGLCEYLVDHWDPKTQTATCKIKRRGKVERVEVFTMAQAARIKTREGGREITLSQKSTYQSYPDRMCGWRARTYAIRAEFADVLRGMAVAEEVMDYPTGRGTPVVVPIRASQIMPDAPSALPAAQDQVSHGDQVDGEPATPMPSEPPADDQSITPPAEQGPPSPPLTVKAAEEVKSGTKPGGAPWTLYRVTLSDGREAHTFSDSLYALAYQALVEDRMVIATTGPGKKAGQVMLVALEIA
jgi:hypothetical protein